MCFRVVTGVMSGLPEAAAPSAVDVAASTLCDGTGAVSHAAGRGGLVTVVTAAGCGGGGGCVRGGVTDDGCGRTLVATLLRCVRPDARSTLKRTYCPFCSGLVPTTLDAGQYTSPLR